MVFPVSRFRWEAVPQLNEGGKGRYSLTQGIGTIKKSKYKKLLLKLPKRDKPAEQIICNIPNVKNVFTDDDDDDILNANKV